MLIQVMYMAMGQGHASIYSYSYGFLLDGNCHMYNIHCICHWFDDTNTRAIQIQQLCYALKTTNIQYWWNSARIVAQYSNVIWIVLLWMNVRDGFLCELKLKIKYLEKETSHYLKSIFLFVITFIVYHQVFNHTCLFIRHCPIEMIKRRDWFFFYRFINVLCFIK